MNRIQGIQGTMVRAVRIHDIVQKHVKLTDKSKWMDVKLSDPKLKFEILRDCTSLIGRDIPNLDLNFIETVGDAAKFYLGEEKKDPRIGHPVAAWFIENEDKLPPNMSFIPYVKELGVKRENRKKIQKK
ncbi:9295_t:CDS:2 [Scutellospora calospora]|uniref:9295_t:CDS:1 n=1 Tax=Scutellospora calospora TaxID=85575 RepID=A0ACA9K1A0_9GLOM|nr:9295_t:CDS:2 [Scutellospora calospora]